MMSNVSRFVVLYVVGYNLPKHASSRFVSTCVVFPPCAANVWVCPER